MTRIYTALARLAGVTLLVGLVTAIMVTVRAAQNLGIGIGPTGLVDSLTSFVVFQLISIFEVGAFTLIAGVTLMGIVTAWAEQRRRWLTVLLLVTIASILLPFATNAWEMLHPSLTPSPYASQNTWLSESLAFINYTAQLTPVALILVFARGHEGAARRKADADLAITRSPL